MPRAELNRRQLEANKRHVVARNCAPQIAEFNAKRKVGNSYHVLRLLAHQFFGFARLSVQLWQNATLSHC